MISIVWCCHHRCQASLCWAWKLQFVQQVSDWSRKSPGRPAAVIPDPLLTIHHRVRFARQVDQQRLHIEVEMAERVAERCELADQGLGAKFSCHPAERQIAAGELRKTPQTPPAPVFRAALEQHGLPRVTQNQHAGFPHGKRLSVATAGVAFRRLRRESTATRLHRTGAATWPGPCAKGRAEIQHRLVVRARPLAGQGGFGQLPQAPRYCRLPGPAVDLVIAGENTFHVAIENRMRRAPREA